MADSDVIDTIIAEAVGDGSKGMTAVAWTIANRAAQMGITPAQVVRQKSQFEGYSNPGSKAKQAQDNPAIRQRVEKIWSDVVNGRVPDPTHGGTMFHAASMTPYWADEANRHGTVRIGNQIYYKGSGGNPALAAIQSVAPSPRPPNLDDIRLSYIPVPQDRPSPSPVLPPIPREPYGMVQAGNIDLMHRPVVRNPDGSISTVRSISIGTDKGETLIPTVSPDGRILSDGDAIKLYEQTGQNLGSFRSVEAANRFAEQLHEAQADRYLPRTPDLGTSLALNPATQAVPDINIGRYNGPAFDTSYPRNNSRDYATIEGARPFASPANAFGLSISDMVRGRSAAPPIPADAFQRVTARNNAALSRPSGEAPPIPADAYQRITARNTALLSRPTGEQAPVPADAYQRITARNNAILNQVTPTPIPGYTDLQAMMPAPQPAFSKPIPSPAAAPAARVASSADLDMMKALRAVPSAPPIPTIAYADIPNVPGPASLPKAQDRLSPSPAGLPANYGTIPQVAVATQLDTVPPVPQSRPKIPVPQMPTLPTLAPPIPAPPLKERPTSFFPGVNLPGILGLAQGFSKAMNNARGPFKSSLDSLIYNTMRGGNFDRPETATTIGTNGYLYAPKQGGGWVNVGRAPGFTFNPVGSGQSSPDAIHSGGGHVYNPDTHDWERDLT